MLLADRIIIQKAIVAMRKAYEKLLSDGGVDPSYYPVTIIVRCCDEPGGHCYHIIKDVEEPEETIAED